MTDRKTITIDAEIHGRLQSRKRDGESWNDFFDRLMSDGTTDPQEDHPVNALNTLTEDHIDDIAVRTARETVDELETRQR